MFNGELPLLVKSIPYVLSLMCVPYKDFFLSYNGPGSGHLCHTDIFLIIYYRLPLARLFAAPIRPTPDV